MSRVWLMPVVAVLSVVAPSVAQAQYAVVSPCGYDCARISIVPAPPVGVPAWLAPRPAVPVYVPPVSVPPVYAAPRSGGLDPWIPLAVQPMPSARPGDVVNQLLLLEALAAARDRRQAPMAAPVYVAPAPTRATGDGWMSAYIKGVK
jgi:hypothetical protein